MAIDPRDHFNEGCEDCGKVLGNADEILPVSHGRWSLGPEWYCGGCFEQ